MKSEEKVQAQRKELQDQLQDQLNRMYAHIPTIDGMGIEAKGLYSWAKCLESGIKALDWVLADESYVNIVY
jgi:hypothetical protein